MCIFANSCTNLPQAEAKLLISIFHNLYYSHPDLAVLNHRRFEMFRACAHLVSWILSTRRLVHRIDVEEEEALLEAAMGSPKVTVLWADLLYKSHSSWWDPTQFAGVHFKASSPEGVVKLIISSGLPCYDYVARDPSGKGKAKAIPLMSDGLPPPLLGPHPEKRRYHRVPIASSPSATPSHAAPSQPTSSRDVTADQAPPSPGNSPATRPDPDDGWAAARNGNGDKEWGRCSDPTAFNLAPTWDPNYQESQRVYPISSIQVDLPAVLPTAEYPFVPHSPPPDGQPILEDNCAVVLWGKHWVEWNGTLGFPKPRFVKTVEDWARDQPIIEQLMLEDPELDRATAKAQVKAMSKKRKTGFTWTEPSDGRGDGFDDDEPMRPIGERPPSPTGLDEEAPLPVRQPFTRPNLVESSSTSALPLRPFPPPRPLSPAPFTSRGRAATHSSEGSRK